MIRKSFTVDDANQLIPVLDQVFRSIDQKKERVRRHGKKLEVLSLLWGDKVGESSNPDHVDYIRHKRAVGKTVSEIEQLIQDESQPVSKASNKPTAKQTKKEES